ncbi:hypothetical protein RUA8715_02284 [Ruegeria arenilitoris]|uniref:Uncharacterized protein n=1 Tax=Ruegeria arenilitoris TaxID=1173585 RepID=A0A238KLU6_9RHOB|nr:hypothetical protein RUA8715_02284 [Ruegeria arenilitoris]
MRSKRLLKLFLSALLVGSLTLSALNIWQIVNNPASTLLVERGLDELRLKYEKALSKAASPELIEQRLSARLSETPRDWIAIEALQGVAEDKKIELREATKEQIQAAASEDSGFFKTSGKCLKCALDAAQCELSAVLFCQLPVALTPIGDVSGIVKGGYAYSKGQDVDEVDVILSVVGLTAVAAAYPSAGTSLSIKAGAGMAKLMNSVGALPTSIRKQFVRSFEDGVEWSQVTSVRSIEDLRALIKPAVLNETVEMVSYIGKISGSMSTVDAIYVVKRVDGIEDLVPISRASEALKGKTVGAMEVMGKNKFIRTTMKWSDEAASVILGLVGLLSALVGLFWSVLTSAMLRVARRTASKS